MQRRNTADGHALLIAVRSEVLSSIMNTSGPVFGPLAKNAQGGEISLTISNAL